MSKCSCGRTFQGAGSRCPQCRRDERWEDTFANTDWEGDEDEKPEVLSDGGRDGVCPECSSSKLIETGPRVQQHRFRCRKCGHRFDEPIEAQHGGHAPTNIHPLGREAMERDPDSEDLITDGGAIDHDFDENELSAREQLLEEIAGIQTEPMAGGVAIDLVTRQPLFVRRVVANSVVEYYEEEEFDLLSYKTHPYLPVRLDDTVYECVYIAGNPEQAHNAGNTYDFPRGRLMHCPVEEAWADEAGDAE